MQGTDVLEAVGAAVRSVADGLGPSVVAVGGGTGVVLGDGLVATNAHNLRGETPTVVFADGRRVDATVTGVDPDGDLAVLAVDTAGAPAVRWATRPAVTGDVVVAVANPGGRGVRATVGTVSAVDRPFRGPRGRRIDGGLEHTASLARGSSGGPLAEVGGAVVALNTHRAEHGFYLARPVDDALRRRLDALGRGEEPDRPRLGVALAPPRATVRVREAAGLTPVAGLLVRAVEDDSPAARADIRRGDVLVAAAGRPLDTVDALFEVLEGAAGQLDLEVVRGDDHITVAVALAADGGPATGGG